MQIARAFAVAAVLALAACSSEESGPYMDIGGGGFLFNYRLAEATEGLIVLPKRALPEGGKIEVTFQNPAGGEAFVLTEAVRPKVPRYDFTTPPLTGVKASVDYLATIRLLDASGKELEKVEKKFQSELDQSVLPEKPLTVGPGYAKNPEAKENQPQ